MDSHSLDHRSLAFLEFPFVARLGPGLPISPLLCTLWGIPPRNLPMAMRGIRWPRAIFGLVEIVLFKMIAFEIETY